MLSFKDNPPIKLDRLSTLNLIKGDWFVAHTKARNEKQFAWDLTRQGVPYFLPMIEKVTFSGGRKRRGMTPLFAGYVFFSGDGETRYTAMKTGRLCQVIPVTERDLFVSEIVQIDRMLLAGGDIEFFPNAAIGNAVRVIGGPYEGVEGVVARHDESDDVDELKVVLRVSMLGVGAMVRVAPSLLVPADQKITGTPKARQKFELVEPAPRVIAKPDRSRLQRRVAS